jgi:hypothetical protein
MKINKLTHLAVVLFSPLLCQCVIESDGNGNIPGTSNSGTATQLPGNTLGFNQPLTVTKGPGMVFLREGNRNLSSPRTAMPNVEETRWHSEQEQIVVKSRGNHGPATVQLFDSRSGAERGRVMAYEIRNGQPAWAASMSE